jgi:hypothetical protein
MAVLVLVTYGPATLTLAFAPDGYNSVTAVLLGTILFAPIVFAGAANFSLNILKGGAPEIGRMFAYANDLPKMLRIWLAALVYGGPDLLTGGSMLLGTALLPKAIQDANTLLGMMVGLTAVNTVLSFVCLWFKFRMNLFPYAVVGDPDARASEWLRTSWRTMKGHCGRLLRLMISVYWPNAILMIVTILVFAQLGATDVIDEKSSIAKLLLNLVGWVFLCFYQGYPQLALAGFADDLLGGKRFDAPKGAARKGAAAR